MDCKKERQNGNCMTAEKRQRERGPPGILALFPARQRARLAECSMIPRSYGNAGYVLRMHGMGIAISNSKSEAKEATQNREGTR